MNKTRNNLSRVLAIAGGLGGCAVSPCPGTNTASIELDYSSGQPQIAALETCWGKDSDSTDITVGKDAAGNLTVTFSSTMARGQEAQAAALAAQAESQARLTELLNKALDRVP